MGLVFSNTEHKVGFLFCFFKQKKDTLYPNSGMAFLSQCEGTLSAVEELELFDDVLQRRHAVFILLVNSLKTATNQDQKYLNSLNQCAQVEVKIPLQLVLHVMSRHKARPPPDISLGFEFYILLIHRLVSCRIFEMENILLFASTERNLCISVFKVYILQGFRSH